jgi:hypothetical protein
MIRTTREASLFGLWRDAALLDALASTENLTTARYEPVTRSLLGTGLVDLVFERRERSCVVGSIRLDPNSLITRERSPFIWPAHIASVLDAHRLQAFEAFLTPWLRSLARARPMAHESIRRYAPSARFDRAREADLLGAAPLERVIRLMAPFIYARRFALGSHVLVDCVDEGLAHAVLGDLAASLVDAGGDISDASGDRAFARAWYGIRSREPQAPGARDLVLVDCCSPDHRFGSDDRYGPDKPSGSDDRYGPDKPSGSSDRYGPDVHRGPDDDFGPDDRCGPVGTSNVIETSPLTTSTGAAVDVPSPVPLDLLFSFDAADAPAISRFAVHAAEPQLRALPLFQRPKLLGGSSGDIVIALSDEALAMRGADVDEAKNLKQCLADEGFSSSIVTEIGDPSMAGAQLAHIFGAPFEAHTIAFAQAARQNGAGYVFDVPPRPQSPSAFVETMLVVALRSATDDAERARYLEAYEERRVTGATGPEPSPEEYARIEERFAELARGAVAILAAQEDIESLRALLPPSAKERVLARGIFASPEPPPSPIGHLVPSAPFAFVHASIGARSHALFTALAAESRAVPLVVAGPCYDVEYLQTLRANAPSAVVLADPDDGVISALYRRASIWVDAAPRPPSAGGLFRAAACGALPVLAAESPLVRIVGAGAPTFRLTSSEDCATTLALAMSLTDRDDRIAALQARLAPRRDLAQTFGGLMAAYAVATPVSP